MIRNNTPGEKQKQKQLMVQVRIVRKRRQKYEISEWYKDKCRFKAFTLGWSKIEKGKVSHS